MRWFALLTLLLPCIASAGECLVVAHRGASAYLPEHTLAAYQLAIEQGADYIEPDVVLTSDGVPIVRHEIQLDLTTDVAEHLEFAHLRSSRQLYGQKLEGWFVDDFTLAQLKTLRARERWPDIRTRNADHDGKYQVPTLKEVIALAAHAEREVGLYIEFKDPMYFRERGQQIVETVLAELSEAGLNKAAAPVLLQSFDPGALRRAAEGTSLPLIQLLFSDQGVDLADISNYASGIGIPKYDFDLDYTAAHEQGLKVHVYTFRAEAEFLPVQYDGSLAAEIGVFLDRGMDGFFTDNPDIGRAVCDGRERH